MINSFFLIHILLIVLIQVGSFLSFNFFHNTSFMNKQFFSSLTLSLFFFFLLNTGCIMIHVKKIYNFKNLYNFKKIYNFEKKNNIFAAILYEISQFTVWICNL